MRLFLVSILLAALTAVYADPIVTDYVKNPASGISYRLVYQAQTWDTAKAMCEAEGAKLAVPKSEEEFAYLQQTLRVMKLREIQGAEYKHLVWLGASNLNTFPVWKTIDGENIEDNAFHTWAGNNGKPYSANPREPHCMGMDSSNHGFRDWWCHLSQPYLCQKDL